MPQQHLIVVLALIGFVEGREGDAIGLSDAICNSPDKSTQYIQQDPNFVAIDAKTGKQKWTFALNVQKNYTWTTSCMSSPDGAMVYVANTSHSNATSDFCDQCSSVIAIDASTGEQRWAVHNFGVRIVFDILTTSSTLYLHDYRTPDGFCKGFYAIDQKTGKMVSFDGLTYDPYDGCPGDNDTPGMKMNPDKSMVYLADSPDGDWDFAEGGVHAFDAHTAKLKWFFGNISKYYALEPESVSTDGLKLVVSAVYCPSEYCPHKNQPGTVNGKFVVDTRSGKQMGNFTPTPTSATFLV